MNKKEGAPIGTGNYHEERRVVIMFLIWSRMIAWLKKSVDKVAKGKESKLGYSEYFMLKGRLGEKICFGTLGQGNNPRCLELYYKLFDHKEVSQEVMVCLQLFIEKMDAVEQEYNESSEMTKDRKAELAGELNERLEAAMSALVG